MKYLMILMLALILPSLATAAPNVKVSIAAEKEVVIIEQGKRVKKRVSADEVFPGDTVYYILTFDNKGNEEAKDVVLVDPIPESTMYINGTAFGPGSEITFSIDQGKTYKNPSLLSYKVDGKKRVASPEQYTHIRWIVKSLKPGKSGHAGFQVRVK